MRKWLGIVMLVFLVLVTVLGSGLVPALASPDVYIVKGGDTLWDLAEEFLRDGFKYMEIMEATNARHAEDPSYAFIEDPDLIRVGWKLEIPAVILPEPMYEGWKTYTNEEFGYTVRYPGACKVMGADLNEMVEFVGPEVEYMGTYEHWPRLSIEHYDSDFYHPPLGTDVNEWVKRIPGLKLGAEFEVANLPTAHLVQERSPQAYAADHYYFVKGTQLYHIQLLHAADREDWDLYNKFLNSFTFREN